MYPDEWRANATGVPFWKGEHQLVEIMGEWVRMCGWVCGWVCVRV